MREAIVESVRRGDETPWEAMFEVAMRSSARGSTSILINARSQSRWFQMWWELRGAREAGKRRKRRAA